MSKPYDAFSSNGRSNQISVAAVPRASCKDCELEEASTAREILDNLCANDFSEYPHLPCQQPHGLQH